MADVGDPEQDGAGALWDGETLADIRVSRSGRTLSMLGRAGPERELSFLPPAEPSPAEPVPQTSLPVLLGAGAGHALAELIARLLSRHGPDFRLIVVDKEADILAAGRLISRFSAHPGLVWITLDCLKAVFKSLTLRQEEAGGLPLQVLVNPFYLRLDRGFYSPLEKACRASARADFWQQVQYPKFKDASPRILLLTSSYFLMGEVIAACKRLDFAHHLLQIPKGEFGQDAFVEQLLSAVVDFRPDFALTINHLGVDREGVLTDLLGKLRLPLASWFVDNPHLILSLYAGLVSPWVCLFTWDADNLKSLRALGFEFVHYLPLGTDVRRFLPGAAPLASLPAAWSGTISFVGNSMVSKVDVRRNSLRLPAALMQSCRTAAEGFADSEHRAVRDFLEEVHPDLLAAFDGLESMEDRLGYETMLTWQATLQYRLRCVQAILPLAPLIVGDKGWRELLGPPEGWLYHSELRYYDQLPHLYPASAINFNCTSKQMKGAVNQRVFDVPAARSFLLTDYRAQLENLFEPSKEICCFHSPDEALDLAKRFLASPAERKAVAAAAHRRVLAEHTYEHRLSALAARMRSAYA
ncbi:MAG: glycosyltransferase [Deltaproteobacteria bacterium]|jgi:spore maturation protein CgeB|nr:glycosyltransferase [Deltaproteobacteria bacterium]